MEVTVTVTSERDIPELYVMLQYDVDVSVEGMENWEEPLTNPHIGAGFAGWDVSINAHQTLDFTRTLYLPLVEGHFPIIAWISEEDFFQATNELVIVMTAEGGTLYLANTPIPQTTARLSTIEPHELATLLAMPTYTPWSTMVPPTATIPFAAYPPPTEQGREGPGTPYP